MWMSFRIGLLAALGLPGAAMAQTTAAAIAAPPPAIDRAAVANLSKLSVSAFDALKGEGLFYFSGTRVTNLRLRDQSQGNRFPVVETTSDPSATSFNGHIDVRSFVRDGERHAVGRPTFAIPVPDGTVQLVYDASSPLHIDVQLEAFDVSGQPVRNFLRTPQNYMIPEAQRAGNASFPPGSVAYLATIRFLDDVLMLPQKESFTGAANTRAMVANFSKQTPYCLSYENRHGARPYAMLFREPGGSRGKVSLYAAKAGTVFCARGSDQPLAEGTWEETTVGGTKALVLSFGANVDPQDTGVMNVEREAAAIAFIEPSKGAPGVRPGKLYRAGARIFDHQFRFNATAAEAIKSSLGIL